jgi:hypothetical protein
LASHQVCGNVADVCAFAIEQQRRFAMPGVEPGGWESCVDCCTDDRVSEAQWQAGLQHTFRGECLNDLHDSDHGQV